MKSKSRAAAKSPYSTWLTSPGLWASRTSAATQRSCGDPAGCTGNKRSAVCGSGTTHQTPAGNRQTDRGGVPEVKHKCADTSLTEYHLSVLILFYGFLLLNDKKYRWHQQQACQRMTYPPPFFKVYEPTLSKKTRHSMSIYTHCIHMQRFTLLKLLLTELKLSLLHLHFQDLLKHHFHMCHIIKCTTGFVLLCCIIFV